jgi:ABC-type tungstate transport system substrate-binding protein
MTSLSIEQRFAGTVSLSTGHRTLLGHQLIVLAFLVGVPIAIALDQFAVHWDLGFAFALFFGVVAVLCAFSVHLLLDAAGPFGATTRVVLGSRSVALR